MNKITYFTCAAIVAAAVLGCSKSKEEQKDLELKIQGKINLAENLKSNVSQNDTVFLIARPAAGGPPLAVKRWNGKDYPYTFTLTNQDLMIPDQILDTPLNLYVRVDKDGDAMTRNPGDLAGQFVNNPVGLKAQDVNIEINEVQN